MDFWRRARTSRQLTLRNEVIRDKNLSNISCFKKNGEWCVVVV